MHPMQNQTVICIRGNLLWTRWLNPMLQFNKSRPFIRNHPAGLTCKEPVDVHAPDASSSESTITFDTNQSQDAGLQTVIYIRGNLACIRWLKPMCNKSRSFIRNHLAGLTCKGPWTYMHPMQNHTVICMCGNLACTRWLNPMCNKSRPFMRNHGIDMQETCGHACTRR
jgi:hypothetical protein